MEKERFYKIAVVLLGGMVLVLGLVLLLRKPPKIPVKPPVSGPVRPVKAGAGKIAIVIDDVGNSQTNWVLMESMKKYPITFSIIPGLSFSEEAARELSSQGFQLLLHLPMEPKEKMNLEPDTILVSMDESRIRSIVNKALSGLPQIKGVNNHMGSRVTEDEKTLTVVLEELKNKHLFFLDSFVTANSVGKKVALKENIPFVKRDVFLDNSAAPESIKRQIETLKSKARQRGEAVGIGHDRRATLEVLSRELPEMEHEGYKLVFVSELAR